jgi:hypothetical protein
VDYFAWTTAVIFQGSGRTRNNDGASCTGTSVDARTAQKQTGKEAGFAGGTSRTEKINRSQFSCANISTRTKVFNLTKIPFREF